jgi:hypothetical protein
MEKVTKQVLTIDDLMTILDCKKDTAYKKMREIKAVSDIWEISGIVAKEDYQYYIESRKGKAKK